MAPLYLRLAIWLITMLPCIGFAQGLLPADSSAILSRDSVAYRLYLSNPDSSIRICTATLSRSLAYDNKFLAGLSYYILSKAYWTKANYKLSAEFGFKALRTYENSPHLRLWGKSLLSLGRTFVDLQNYDQGKVYIVKAIALGKLREDKYLLAEALREKSMLLSELKEYDSALYYSDEGIKLFEELKDSISISILYSRKGKIYFNQKKYDLSHLFNRKALHYDSLLGNRRALGIAYYQSALDLVHLNKYDSAIIFLQKSIPLNLGIHNLSTLIKAHTLLAGIYQEQKKPDLAIANLKKASLYKDSLYNTEKSGQIQEMQSLYELSSKEHTIQQLELDNVLQQERVSLQRIFVGLLLLCVMFLGLTIFFLQRYRRLQQKTNDELAAKNTSIEQQKEEIQSQAETLHHLNHLKSKLFSVISHDLRGPMATLHSLVDMLLKKNVTIDEFLLISEKLRTSLDITQRTLENLLNWSLSQMEGLKTEPRTIDIHEMIGDACKLLEEVAESKNVNIHLTVESLFVRADADQLQLILRNLIHNAIKFSKPFENIRVSASKDSNFCFITVKDTGIGMTKSEIETVISSRHHFSKTGTMQEKGTGLGLLLCQEFIKLNGGDIKIKSNLNQGTEVTFTLPLAYETIAAEVEV